MELHLQITESEMDDISHGRTVTHVMHLEHVIVKTHNGRRSLRVKVAAANVGLNRKEQALFLNLKLETPSNG